MFTRQRVAAIVMVVLSCYTGLFIVNISLRFISESAGEAKKRASA